MAKKVMVVEDDPGIQRLVDLALRVLDVAIVHAWDGSEALVAVEKAKPDLLLTDQSMPRMDGSALIDRLRRREGGRDLPVIVLTSRTGFMDKSVMTKLSGVDAHFVKPFQPRELRDAVRRLLRLPGAAR